MLGALPRGLLARQRAGLVHWVAGSEEHSLQGARGATRRAKRAAWSSTILHGLQTQPLPPRPHCILREAALNFPRIGRQPSARSLRFISPASCRFPGPTALPAAPAQPPCLGDAAGIAPVSRQPCAGAAAGVAAALRPPGDGTAAAGPTCTGRSRSGPPTTAATRMKSMQRRHEASWAGIGWLHPPTCRPAAAAAAFCPAAACRPAHPPAPCRRRSGPHQAALVDGFAGDAQPPRSGLCELARSRPRPVAFRAVAIRGAPHPAALPRAAGCCSLPSCLRLQRVCLALCPQVPDTPEEEGLAAAAAEQQQQQSGGEALRRQALRRSAEKARGAAEVGVEAATAAVAGVTAGEAQAPAPAGPPAPQAAAAAPAMALTRDLTNQPQLAAPAAAASASAAPQLQAGAAPAQVPVLPQQLGAAAAVPLAQHQQQQQQASFLAGARAALQEASANGAQQVQLQQPQQRHVPSAQLPPQQPPRPGQAPQLALHCSRHAAVAHASAPLPGPSAAPADTTPQALQLGPERTPEAEAAAPPSGKTDGGASIVSGGIPLLAAKCITAPPPSCFFRGAASIALPCLALSAAGCRSLTPVADMDEELLNHIASLERKALQAGTRQQQALQAQQAPQPGQQQQGQPAAACPQQQVAQPGVPAPLAAQSLPRVAPSAGAPSSEWEGRRWEYPARLLFPCTVLRRNTPFSPFSVLQPAGRTALIQPIWPPWTSWSRRSLGRQGPQQRLQTAPAPGLGSLQCPPAS